MYQGFKKEKSLYNKQVQTERTVTTISSFVALTGNVK